MPADDSKFDDGFEATAERLTKVLRRRPVLWVGAGASMAAGYPSTGALMRKMIEAADEPIDDSLSFTEVADAFVDQMGGGLLGDILQEQLGPPREPAPLHRAIARLAGSGSLHTILTTNYDGLIERTLDEAGIAYVLQTLDRNQQIADDQLRLIKLHGSRDDWKTIVLSGKSYDGFTRRYRFLTAQLDVLLQQRGVLLVGCSLQDPRILDWLAKLPKSRRDQLKPWRPLMTAGAWRAACQATVSGRSAGDVLARAPIRPLILRDHDQLNELLPAAAGQLAPPPAPTRLDLMLTVGDEIRAELDGCETWTADNPLTDDGFVEGLERLRELDHRPLPTSDDGTLAGPAAVVAGGLRQLANGIGRRVTESLLSEPARQQLQTAIRAAAGGEPPWLVVHTRPADDRAALREQADRLLALPWELIVTDDGFPVEQGALDVAREAARAGLPELDEPDRPLSVVATVAAPVDATTLDHEAECFRMWRAMGRRQRCLLLTDLGTPEALVEAVREHRPPVVHFTGHGRPGGLLFEDDAALTREVSVDDLVRRLRSAHFPRLIYLAACHGASPGEQRVAGVERSEPPGSRPPATVPRSTTNAPADQSPPESQPGGSPRMTDPALAQPSTPPAAAALHRAGVPQVVAYFGPVGDEQSTRCEEAFYAALAAGRTARQAVRRAREIAVEPHRRDGHATHIYPLGWAQLALYHRGPDLPTTLAVRDVDSLPDVHAADRQRIIEQLDSLSDRRGVRGVQQVRFGFVGRRRSRSEAIRRWRTGLRVLIVQGLGGLGKTALCTEIAPILARRMARAAGLSGEGSILALDGRTAGLRGRPIESLWEEVTAAESDEAWGRRLAELQANGVTGLATATAVLELARRRGSLLVYLDDAESLQRLPGNESPTSPAEDEENQIGQWADADIATFWSQLVQAAQPDGPLGLLASSRYQPAAGDDAANSKVPSPQPRATQIAGKSTRVSGLPPEAHLPLPVMGRMDVVKLLRWFPTLGRAAAEDWDWLASDVIDGHPRTIEYLDGLAHIRAEQTGEPGRAYHGDNWRGNILEPILPKTKRKVDADLLLPRVWEAIGPAAREHLGRLSLLTSPAPWPLIEHSQIEPGTGHELMRAGLLSPFLSPDGRDTWWAPHRLVVELAESRWDGDHEAAHRTFGQWFLEHADEDSGTTFLTAAAEHLLASGDGDAAWPAVHRLVLAVRGAGRYRQTLAWIERALAAGPTGARRGLALAFQVQIGRLVGEPPADAERMLQEAEGLVARDDLAFVLGERGGWLQRQGRLREAAEALTQCVEVGTEIKGEVHAEVAISLNNLAGVLQAQGDLEGARSKLERSLEIQAEVFGTELHPNVAASLHSLAGVLQAQGDLEGARAKLERSLEIKAEVFGTELHPDVGASLHQLAGVLQAQGDLEGARARLERVLEIEEKVYGTREHYSTAITEWSLATLLAKLGETERAAELLEHAYGVFRRQLGDDHPHTRQLAEMLGKQ